MASIYVLLDATDALQQVSQISTRETRLFSCSKDALKWKAIFTLTLKRELTSSDYSLTRAQTLRYALSQASVSAPAPAPQV